MADDPGGHASRGPARTPESEDPFEEQTQPIAGPGEGSDTTSWDVRQAPPVLIADPTPPAPGGGDRVPQPETEATAIVEPLVEGGVGGLEPEAEATVVSGADAGVCTTRGSIAPSASLRPMLLERIEPSLGRGERLRLDAAHWRVCLGRAEHNDVRLYTASASREHAQIEGNDAGEWVLTPGADKLVIVDGERVKQPIALEVGMNIVLGGDHLRCVTEGLSRPEMAAPTAADAFDAGSDEGVPWTWWAIGGVALLGIGLILYAWSVT